MSVPGTQTALKFSCQLWSRVSKYYYC